MIGRVSRDVLLCLTGREAGVAGKKKSVTQQLIVYRQSESKRAASNCVNPSKTLSRERKSLSGMKRACVCPERRAMCASR